MCFIGPLSGARGTLPLWRIEWEGVLIQEPNGLKHKELVRAIKELMMRCHIED